MGPHFQDHVSTDLVSKEKRSLNKFSLLLTSKWQISMVSGLVSLAPTDGHQIGGGRWQAVQSDRQWRRWAAKELTVTIAQWFYSQREGLNGKSQAQLKPGGWEMAQWSFSQGCLSPFVPEGTTGHPALTVIKPCCLPIWRQARSGCHSRTAPLQVLPRT